MPATIPMPPIAIAAMSQRPPHAENQSRTVPRSAIPSRSVSRPMYAWKTRK